MKNQNEVIIDNCIAVAFNFCGLCSFLSCSYNCYALHLLQFVSQQLEKVAAATMSNVDSLSYMLVFDVAEIINILEHKHRLIQLDLSVAWVGVMDKCQNEWDMIEG